MIILQKGQKIDLTKGNAGLTRLMVGLGWDEAQPNKKNGFWSSMLNIDNIDCDASVILIGKNGHLYGSGVKDYLVYFGNLKHKSQALIHQGDNLTGEGDGDDEQIMVDLNKIPDDVSKLVFIVNIYDANKRNQHFGMIENAFIRIVNLSNNQEICRYNLSENYDNMTGMIVGEIYRYKEEWKFNAIGQPVKEASRISNLVELYV